jgi:uncharacterized protein
MTIKLVSASLLMLSLAAPVAAGPLDDAKAAFRREDYAAALQLFRPLAEQGNVESERIVGSMYKYGWGVPQNYVEALKWLRKAADQGDSLAQLQMGEIFYAGGAGVPQNYTEAMKWYLKAVDNEHDIVTQAQAQFMLGFMCLKGEGLTQDFVAAHMWFNLSAARGALRSSGPQQACTAHDA